MNLHFVTLSLKNILVDAKGPVVISSRVKRLRCLSALWALCHGNNEHIGIVAESEEFFRHWSTTIDDCIHKDSDPLLASLCLGVGATVFVNGPKQKLRLIEGRAPSKIVSLLGKWPQSASTIIHSSALLGHLIQGIIDTDHARDDTIEALRITVNTWKTWHMKNEKVCYSMLENLPFFVDQYTFELTQWTIPELVSESLMMHRGCSSVQICGESLLDSIKKADSKHRRGSILPTSKLRPVAKVRGPSIFFHNIFSVLNLSSYVEPA